MYMLPVWPDMGGNMKSLHSLTHEISDEEEVESLVVHAFMELCVQVSLPKPLCPFNTVERL